MYFSSVGATVKICKAEMDGRNKECFFNYTKTASTFVDLALDKMNNKLIICDQHSGLIRSIDLANWELRTIDSGYIKKPRSLAVSGSSLFVFDDGEGQFSGTLFMTESTNARFSPKMMADGFWNPSGLHSFNSTTFAGKITHPGLSLYRLRFHDYII